MKANHLSYLAPLLFLLTSMAAVTVGQVQSKENVDLQYRRTLTETQIEQVSNDLIKDATLFQPVERAILWSRLGELWWKTDAPRARRFLSKAVEDLEAATAANNTAGGSQATDSAQLIGAIRVALRIIAARDQKLSDRLQPLLTTLAENKGNAASSNSNYIADALVEAGMQVVSENPARAAQLGSASLRYGDASKFNLLLIELRERNSKLADDLFTEALNAAQLSQNINLFSSLTFAAFTSNYNPNIKATPPSSQLRASLLNTIIKGAVQADLDEKQRDCSYAFLIVPLLNEVDRFVPQQGPPVRNAVARCKSVAPGSDEALRNQPLKTAEDFLSAARNAESVELRVLFLSRAVQAAGKSGNLDLAISVLDGMSREEREAMGDAWDPIRVQYGTLAATRRYENKDFAAMERIISAVPQELQPFVTLNLAEAILGQESEKNTLVIDLLSRTRRNFEKLEHPDFNTFYPYMSLVRAYGKVSPQDAYSVFREAVKSINRATVALKDKPDSSEQTARGQFEPLDIPAELVQLSAFDLIGIVSSVDSAALRTRLRLSLLSSLLNYKQSLLKTPERPMSKTKSGATL